MTKDDALKLALEALEYPLNQSHENFNVDMAELLSHRAIATIKQALEQPEQLTEKEKISQAMTAEIVAARVLAKPEQKPVAWMTPDREGFRIRFSPPTNDVPLGWDALYTTPPKREWVGLTHEQTKDCVKTWDKNDAYELCRAIEAKLKEKNT